MTGLSWLPCCNQHHGTKRGRNSSEYKQEQPQGTNDRSVDPQEVQHSDSLQPHTDDSPRQAQGLQQARKEIVLEPGNEGSSNAASGVMGNSSSSVSATVASPVESPSPATISTPPESLEEAPSPTAASTNALEPLQEEGPAPQSPGAQHSEGSTTSSGEQRRSSAAGGGGSNTGTHMCPPHGAKAIIGRRSKMEDAYKAVPFLLEVPIEHTDAEEKVPPRVAVHLQNANQAPPQSAPPSGASAANANVQAYRETFHFFGVFDGHGGDAAAQYCSTILHERIAEALADRLVTANSSQSEGGGAVVGSVVESKTSAGTNVNTEELSSSSPVADAAMQGATASAELVSDGVGVGKESGVSERDSATGGGGYSVQMIEDAITEAFCKTDEAFGKDENANLVGTTAVVALVGSRKLYVANCGDSRAVLCRNGTAFALTDDHKAAREDETARIEREGGQILFWNGVRVMGVLAVSRAIGDHCLRPYVIAKPEVTILERRKDDELLLLASDGLWDVLSNQEAASLAKRCLQRAHARGANRETAARIAATVLTRAAVDRGSRDNVTVVVVDLSQQDDIPPGEEGVLEAVQAPMASGAIVEATPEDATPLPLDGMSPQETAVQMEGG